MSDWPWVVRYAIAAHDAGWVLPPWLRLAVAMAVEAGGCPSCGRPRPSAD